MEALVVDAEVVADLVEDGHAHLLADLIIVVMADGFDVALIDADAVGEDEVVVLTPGGEGNAVVETEKEVAWGEIRSIKVFGTGGVLDDEVDVMDLATNGLGYLVEGFADKATEVRAFQG